MILPFSTKLNGQPTYFVEKIWAGLHSQFAEITIKGKIYLMPQEYFNCLDLGFENMKPFKPKIHTLRKDVDDVWQQDVTIEFVLNDENRNSFQFAPVLPVISIQTIEIVWYSHIRILEVSILSPERYNHVEIIIDDKLLTINEIIQLAQNDGFDNIEEFFAYFNTDFKGKIIHWTTFKY